MHFAAVISHCPVCCFYLSLTWLTTKAYDKRPRSFIVHKALINAHFHACIYFVSYLSPSFPCGFFEMGISKGDTTSPLKNIILLIETEIYKNRC